MGTGTFSDEELAAFGVRLEDEHPHPFSPAHEWWNESWFWDWFRLDGSAAGHLRVAFHPNQDRAWLWLFLFDGANWVAIEETRLPLSDWEQPELRYDRFGLRFSWVVHSPLRSGRLRCEGYGRVVSGPDAGLVLPVAVDLDITADGIPHSTGQTDVEGHEDSVYSTSRFEQPIRVSGSCRIGAEVLELEGQGERDHSWGPRDWNLEWIFMVMGGEEIRLQWAAVDIEGLDRIGVGYLQRLDGAHDVVAVDESLELRPSVADTVAGRFEVSMDDGSAITGTVETVSATEIDISHCFVPPRPTTYRRALVRVTVEGRTSLGWLEFNRFDPGLLPRDPRR